MAVRYRIVRGYRAFPNSTADDHFSLKLRSTGNHSDWMVVEHSLRRRSRLCFEVQQCPETESWSENFLWSKLSRLSYFDVNIRYESWWCSRCAQNSQQQSKLCDLRNRTERNVPNFYCLKWKKFFRKLPQNDNRFLKFTAKNRASLSSLSMFAKYSNGGIESPEIQ